VHYLGAGYTSIAALTLAFAMYSSTNVGVCFNPGDTHMHNEMPHAVGMHIRATRRRVRAWLKVLFIFLSARTCKCAALHTRTAILQRCHRHFTLEMNAGAT